MEKKMIVRKVLSCLVVFVILMSAVPGAGFAMNSDKYRLKSDDFIIIEPDVSLSSIVPEEEWTKTFGGTKGDEGYSIQQTSDGGYIIAGGTQSYGDGKKDVWLIKTDEKGNEGWNKTFGGTKDDYSYSVQQTSDGGYIIVGYTESYGSGGKDVWLTKTDVNGNKEWAKTFGGTKEDVGYSVQQTLDGGYIIAGYTESYGSGDKDVWLIKTDASGRKKWSKTFGGAIGYSVQQTSDGGYIVTGKFSYYYLHLIKTDADGNEEWNRTFGEISYPRVICIGYSVRQTSDDGYIITGSKEREGLMTFVPDVKVCLIKTDKNGNEEWNKAFGHGLGCIGKSVQQTSDGGYIAVGMERYEGYGGSGSDVYLLKADQNGDREWSKTFDVSKYDEGYSIQQTSAGGYIIAGCTESYDGNKDVLLIKVEREEREPKIHNVNTGEDFRTIQAAIDDPDTKDGHTITVDPEVYTKDVVVTKSLTIESSEGPAETIVQAVYGHTFEVVADNVTISGFMVTGAGSFLGGVGSAGIYLKANNCNITNNIVKNNEVGINIDRSTNNTLINNTISENTQNLVIDGGLLLSDFIHNIDTSNKVDGKTVYYLVNESNETIGSESDAGYVAVINSYNITIKDLSLKNPILFAWTNFSKIENVSVLYNTSWNIWAENGITLRFSSNNILARNRIAKCNRGIGFNRGIGLYSSSNNIVTHNNISEGLYGVFLWDSTNNCIRNNELLSNDKRLCFGIIGKGIIHIYGGDGISLRQSTNNELANNNILRSFRGIHLDVSPDNKLTNNNVCLSNLSGMYIRYSSNNLIHLNNFDNIENVNSSKSTNIWNSTKKITYTYNGNTYEKYMGNYWSDYRWRDLNGDGIGGIPYPIESDKDNYPLMKKIETYCVEKPSNELSPAPSPSTFLTLILKDEDSYHFRTQELYWQGNGDFSASLPAVGEPKFWSRRGRGLQDLGDIGDTPLDQVTIPEKGYQRVGVEVTLGHTYVSLAREGEEGHYIVFRVVELVAGDYVKLGYLYTP